MASTDYVVRSRSPIRPPRGPPPVEAVVGLHRVPVFETVVERDIRSRSPLIGRVHQGLVGPYDAPRFSAAIL